METFKAQNQCCWKALCDPLPYSTLMRWRQRQRAGLPLWRKPGPKKSSPPDWPALLQDLQRLAPGRTRTRGTGWLYQRYAAWLSRRELVHWAKVLRQTQRDSMKNVHWLRTGLAWSIDATQYGGDGWLIIPIQDLASRYRLPSLTADRLDGQAIAAHLHWLFQRYGPPLLLKRDNGSPFNHHAVDDLLAAYGVLPLNNPPNFPRYNGAMERGISELKRCLDQRAALNPEPTSMPDPRFATSQNRSPAPSPQNKTRPGANGEAQFLPALRFSQFSLRVSRARNFSLTVQNTLHELNHKTRRSLQGQTACACFHDPRRRLWLTKRQRKNIFRLLCRNFWHRVNYMTDLDHHAYTAAWRHTVETWLRCQGLIVIRLNPKVSTILTRDFVS